MSRSVVDRVTNIGNNLYRTFGYDMNKNDYREARIAATIRAGLHHVEVKDWLAAVDWLKASGVDYTFSMDDFWVDDPNVAFDLKLRFG
jgi:hypothetical protein